MNTREVSELRRHIRRDRTNMTTLYGCYVNENKEIICQFSRSTALMSENEAEKYFGILKRSLSGTLGKNLIDICFQTAQVANSPEHKMLMELRATELKDEGLLHAFYQKVIDTVSLKENYLILLGCDRYDVPFRGNDGENDSGRSDESFQFLLCAVCPVKQTQPKLQYLAEDKLFHDGGISNVVSAPELGFLFPAFDGRATNIYNALYYTHSPKESHNAFVDAVFHTPIPEPAHAQKQTFESLLSRTLEEECSLEVVQSVHDALRERIALHREARSPEALTVSKDEMKAVLTASGVCEAHAAKFGIEFESAFGLDAQVHPKNIIDDRRFEIVTPDVSIKIAPDKADLIETRIIGGVKYILVPAEESVEVNGVAIQIGDREGAVL